MLISVNTRIPFPRPLVYSTYRDKLLELIPYLPNVRQIEVKSNWQENGLIYFVNEWHGGGEIPAAARAVLTESMLSWTEFMTWNQAEFTSEWRIETHAFTEAVHCTGKNRFIAEEGTTLIESRGELTIDSRQIHSVPHFLARLVGGMVEDFLGTRIEPNLQQLSEGVRRYLENCQERLKPT